MAKYNFFNPHFPRHSNGWRHDLINLFQSEDCVLGDVYQFGVAGGYSMQVIGSLIQVTRTNFFPTFFGFDVFTGMPVESVEPDKQRDIPESFKLTELFDTNNLDAAIEMLKDDIRSNIHSNSNLIITQGLVEKTLTSNFLIEHQCRPAFYVDIDLDIYSPSKYVLDFLIQNKIIIPGTIIGFDDWGQNYPIHPIFSCGESRAFKEVVDKYNLKYDVIIDTKDQCVVMIR